MRTGIYGHATCILKLSGEESTRELHEASLTIHPSGVAEIIHYEGNKSPDNKRTLFFPIPNLVLFLGHGYAS